MPPTIAFALGSLGFLTPFNIENFEDHLSSVVEGRFYLSFRERLQIKVFRNRGNSLPNGECTEIHQTLNDVCVDRGSSPFLTHLSICIDDQFVTDVRADGIVFSSPTGSTAYSLAAGGSIVHPSVQSILMTPICPHSLSFRPVLFPVDGVLTVQVNGQSRGSASVSFDGRSSIVLDKYDYLEISTSKYPMPAVCKGSEMRDWLTSIREGLHWNSRGDSVNNHQRKNQDATQRTNLTHAPTLKAHDSTSSAC